MKHINESNAGAIRAMLDILNESVEEEVVEAAEETNEEAEEVSEAAEHDLDEKQHSKGELYKGATDMPGKANAKVRLTPADSADNPMVENDLHKSFLEYLKEAEAKETAEESVEEELEEAVEEASDEDESED